MAVGQRMIAEHSTWLTWAMGVGPVFPGGGLMWTQGWGRVRGRIRGWGHFRGRGWRGRSLPRIPVRKVSEGGFARLMSTPAGRYRAERWWERTLDNLGDPVEK